MISRKSEIFSTIIPLEARVKAEKFRCYQSQASKGKQVYLNTLAVWTVNLYLNHLGWSTNLEGSDSQNPVFQTMMNIADLKIPNYGNLECRFIMVGDEIVTIPPEVWTERIGYVVVRLNKSLDRADVLGFVRKIAQSQLSLNELESLREFPAYLSLQQRSTPIESTILSTWFSQKLDRQWQPVEKLFAPGVAINLRSPQKLANVESQLDSKVNRVKLVQFNENISIALILTIQPNNDGLTSQKILMTNFSHESGKDPQNKNALNQTRDSVTDFKADISSASPDIWRSPQEFDISLMVCNSQLNNLLPPGLELVILDQNSHPAMIAQANETETIEFCFSGKLGEGFSIELALEEQTRLESFII